MTSPTLSAIQAQLAERCYEDALEGIKAELQKRPQDFLDSAVWRQFCAPHDWFSTIDETSQYLRYVTSLTTVVANAADDLSDSRGGRNLSSSFLDGAQFRLAAHTNGDPRPLMRARARHFARVLSKFNVLRSHSFQSAVSGSRPRLGVLFKHLVQDPETTSVLPFFDEARAAGIEVLLFVGSNEVDQKFSQYVAQRCDATHQLRGGIESAVAQIRHFDLDILLFGNDITAKPSFFAYLSFFRLARIGAFCISSILTTSSPAMDVYFGSRYQARLGFDLDFDERYVGLPDPGYAFLYPTSSSAQIPVITRDMIKVESDAPLFVSGANYTKLHKPLIAAWAKILHACPKARLVLYPFPPHFSSPPDNLVKRVTTQFSEFGISGRQLRIIPGMPRDVVIGLLRLMDVGLDSFPYTGVTTVVDAMEAALPTVSLCGTSFRTSHAATILHVEGLDDLIVRSVDAYVELAVLLAQNPEKRALFKSKLEAKNTEGPAFFRPKEFSVSVAAAYHQLYDELAAGRFSYREGHL